jgi:glycosyltransferase involved in cell wall biosynthesis
LGTSEAKTKVKIYAHCLVKNEKNFIWYSVTSIVEHVDKVMIWDNGSTDNTVKIIESLKNRWPSKISFKKFSGEVSTARQKMLDETDADWFIVLDGDEVWWDDSIRQLIDKINTDGQNLDSIVVPFKNLIGDMFHFQSENKGQYVIDGKTGFLTIRALNKKIRGLKVGGKYPSEGYMDFEGTPIQNLNKERRMFLDASYLHLTNLKKMKRGLGKTVPLDFYYPEVFFKSKPDFIFCPWMQ